MATDFGTGIAGISGWPLRFVFISGFQLLGQDLCHRLQCIRGSLAWDPNAGWDLRQLLRGTFSASAAKAAESAIASECEKDERVLSATAVLSFIAAARTLLVSISVVTNAGPFLLVLSVDQLTVSVLKVIPQ